MANLIPLLALLIRHIVAMFQKPDVLPKEAEPAVEKAKSTKDTSDLENLLGSCK